MSHIPASVMHHAKVPEPDLDSDSDSSAAPEASSPPTLSEASEPAPVQVPAHRPEAAPVAWAGWAIGGALVAGTALTAFLMARKSTTAPQRKAAAKPAGTPRKQRRKKEAAAE